MVDRVLRAQARLTHRDLTLLGWLADHGVLTTAQIAHALFPSVDVAQERLRTLTLTGVLGRFRPQKPDGGSYPYHYVLDQLGAELIAAQRGDELPRPDQARKRRWHLTNRANLPHLLGVNQFFTDLAGYTRSHPKARLERWWSAAHCQRTGAFAEPGDDPMICAYAAPVRPDGHGVWVECDVRVPFFVEFDSGSEPLGTLISKFDRYASFAHRIGHTWPVLLSLHAPGRERNLQQRLAQLCPRIPVATTVRDSTGVYDANTRRSCPAEAVWWLTGDNGPPLRLVDLSRVVDDTRRRAA